MSSSEFELTASSPNSKDITHLEKLFTLLSGTNLDASYNGLETTAERIGYCKTAIVTQIESHQHLIEQLKAEISKLKSSEDAAALEEKTSELFNANQTLLSKLNNHEFIAALHSITPANQTEWRLKLNALYESARILGVQFERHDTLQEIFSWISRYESVEALNITTLKSKQIWELTHDDVQEARRYFNHIIEANNERVRDLMSHMDINLSAAVNFASAFAKIRTQYQRTKKATEQNESQLQELRLLKSQLGTLRENNTKLSTELGTIRSSLGIDEGGDKEAIQARIDGLLEAEARLAETDELLHQRDAENEALRKMISEENEELDRLNEEKALVTRQLNELGVTHAQLEKEQEKLQRENAQYRAKYDRYQSTLGTKDEEIARINQLLLDNQTEIARLSALNEALQQRIDELEEELTALDAENTRLRALLEENAWLREPEESYQGYIEQADQLILKQKEIIAAQAREINELRSHLDDQSQELSHASDYSEGISDADAEFIGAGHVPHPSLAIYAFEAAPKTCDTIDAIKENNLQLDALALEINQNKTVYSPSGQAYQFKVTDTQSIATLDQIDKSKTEFAQQKLAITTINILQNILINHDVINLDTRNEDIKTYAAYYIHFLNQTYHLEIELKINGHSINLDDAVSEDNDIFARVEPEILTQTNWFADFAKRHQISTSSYGFGN